MRGTSSSSLKAKVVAEQEQILSQLTAARSSTPSATPSPSSSDTIVEEQPVKPQAEEALPVPEEAVPTVDVHESAMEDVPATPVVQQPDIDVAPVEPDVAPVVPLIVDQPVRFAQPSTASIQTAHLRLPCCTHAKRRGAPINLTTCVLSTICVTHMTPRIKSLVLTQLLLLTMTHGYSII